MTKAVKKKTRRARAISYYIGHPVSAEEAAIYVRELIKHDLDHRRAVQATWPSIKGTDLTDLCRSLHASKEFKAMTKDHMSVVTESAGIDAQRSAEILLGHANVTLLDFLNDSYSLKPMSELRKLPLSNQRAIKRIKVTDYRDADGKVYKTDTELHLYDAQHAIKIMGEILGWTKVGDSNSFNVAQYILSGEQRVEKGVTLDAQQPDR